MSAVLEPVAEVSERSLEAQRLLAFLDLFGKYRADRRDVADELRNYADFIESGRPWRVLFDMESDDEDSIVITIP